MRSARGNNLVTIQPATDGIEARIDALYGKFNGYDLLADLAQEHSQEAASTDATSSSPAAEQSSF
jgi:hypothetical protein